MQRRRGAKKPKAVHYQIIERASEAGKAVYALLADLVEQHHHDLRDARIAVAWNTAWKPDVDGRVTLGKMKKASDLDRELAAFDFVVLLRKIFWEDARVSDDQRRALLDHELCHGALKLDDNGEPVEDERGRKVYRIRKHDVEEFEIIVERYGLWTRDLEAMARSFQRQAQRDPFAPCDVCKDSPGWVARTGDDGKAGVVRCECWRTWSERKRGWSEPAA